MVHLEFGLDAPVGGFGVVVSAIQMLYDSIMNSPHLMWKDRWTTSRRVGPALNCPDVELAASSCPRRIGGAELS